MDAAHRFEERHRQRGVIRPGFRTAAVTGTNRVQDLGEQLVNVAACAPCAAIEKSKPANSNVAPVGLFAGALPRRRLVSPRRVRERLARLRDALKQGFSRTVFPG